MGWTLVFQVICQEFLGHPHPALPFDWPRLGLQDVKVTNANTKQREPGSSHSTWVPRLGKRK